MLFEPSARTRDLAARLTAFMNDHIYPNEARVHEETSHGFQLSPTVEALKKKAKSQGLWNLFLPESKRGAGLNNLEYAPLAEIMGRVIWSSEVFNCNPPDTGNMEILERYGTEEQKKQWLEPLLEGE